MSDQVIFPIPPLNRRQVFVKGIAGALALAGFGSRGGIVLAGTPGVSHGETPGVTEGPYWVDGQPNRSDVRLDTTTKAYFAGLPLYLGLTVSQLSDTTPYTISPLVGAKVDIWHASAQGVYSDIDSEGSTGQNYFRGYQLTSSHGIANFLTNYPGWYSGRTPHIHIRVRTYDSSGNVTYNFTTQLFFNDVITNLIYAANATYARTTARDTNNATDSIFTGASFNGSPETEAGDYLLATLADDGTHVQASFHIVVDLSDSSNADNETNGGGGGGTPPTGGGGGTPPTGGGGGTPPSGPPPGGGGAGFGAIKAPTSSSGTTSTSSTTLKPGTLRFKRYN